MCEWIKVFTKVKGFLGFMFFKVSSDSNVNLL